MKTKDQVITELRNEIVACTRKQMALDDLTKALLLVRHHQQPTKAIKKAMEKTNPAWTCAITIPNREKFETGKIEIWGNGLTMNDDVRLLFNTEEWTWDGIFKEIRRFDQCKKIKALSFDVETIDELFQLEKEINDTVAELRKKVRLQPDGDDRSYQALRCFPAIYRGLYDQTDRY